MRYRLRTLLIVLAIGPFICAGAWWTIIDHRSHDLEIFPSHGNLEKYPASDRGNVSTIIFIGDGDGNNYVDDTDMQMLRHFPMLKNLRASETRISDAGLTSLGRCTHLKWLDISDTNVGPQGFCVLADNCKLTVLDCCGTEFDDLAAQCLGKMGSLEELDIRETLVADKGIAELARGCKNLRRLNVSSTRITDAGIEAMCLVASQLEELELLSTQITDKSLITLSRLPRLKSVGLNGTNVTDEGVKDFKLKTKGLVRVRWH